MKTKTLVLIVILFISASIVTGLSSCKRERCYECERLDSNGNPYGQVNVCGEDDKNALEAQHYTCSANGKKRKKH